MVSSEKESAKAFASKSDRRAGLSCAECRRSKLKCDRVFPCSACVRRGCAGICPDGSLTATKGNKVLQSQNETLTQTVETMQARIRDLEEALDKAQSHLSPQPHPLLSEQQRLKEADLHIHEFVKDEEADEAADLIGSLAIGDQGQARFHGDSSSSEMLSALLPPQGKTTDPSSSCDGLSQTGLPSCIIELAKAFPFGIVEPSSEAISILLSYLPEHSKALALSLLFFEQATGLIRPLQQDHFIPFLLRTLLRLTKGLTIGEELHAHEVALIYLVLALGEQFSDEPNSKFLSERYYVLSRAALSLNPLIRDAATSVTLQALFLITHYYILTDSPRYFERRWLMGGILTRLLYSTGLQRDPALWNLSSEEAHRRRILFWEIYACDIMTSIKYGRPPSVNINHADCRFPEDDDPFINCKGEKEMSFNAYKYRFAVFVLAPVADLVFGVRQQNYSALLEMDLKIRKFLPPNWLIAPIRGNGQPVDGRTWNSNPAQALNQYWVLCTRESTLLYIHRKYLATAVKLNGADPLKSKYGASVMAAYRSACIMLSSLQGLYNTYPRPTAKTDYFWSAAFSACIVLASLVQGSPGCSLAKEAFQCLEEGIDLCCARSFPDTPPITQLLRIVRRNIQKSYSEYLDAVKNGKEFTRAYDCDNTTMRVLEGSEVIININDPAYKTRRPSAASSSTQDDSRPSRTSSQAGEKPPELPMERFRGNGMNVAVSDANFDYRALDFTGLHYVPSYNQRGPPSTYQYQTVDTSAAELTSEQLGYRPHTANTVPIPQAPYFADANSIDSLLLTAGESPAVFFPASEGTYMSRTSHAGMEGSFPLQDHVMQESWNIYATQEQ